MAMLPKQTISSRMAQHRIHFMFFLSSHMAVNILFIMSFSKLLRRFHSWYECQWSSQRRLQKARRSLQVKQYKSLASFCHTFHSHKTKVSTPKEEKENWKKKMLCQVGMH